ncbi:MAG: hypothetical protein ACREDL_19750 [Bradyrhizobium sp.]
MKVVRVIAALALLAAPASAWLARPALAQAPSINLLQDNTPDLTPEQKAAAQAREKAYRESLKKIPDAKASNDPWGSVRTITPQPSTARSRHRR